MRRDVTHTAGEMGRVQHGRGQERRGRVCIGPASSEARGGRPGGARRSWSVLAGRDTAGEAWNDMDWEDAARADLASLDVAGGAWPDT